MKRKAAPYKAPQGEILYAIGDIHGRLDLLEALLAKIEQDSAAYADASPRIILLGDLIDRGADSRGVVERVMQLQQEAPRSICLMGNHEKMLLDLYDGEKKWARPFHNAGGRATLLSYGAAVQDYDVWDWPELAHAVRHYVPQSHVDFMRNCPAFYAAGEYYFVHAGVKPGVALADQVPADLLWIRERFTASKAAHGACIVHGHSISQKPDVQPNRIGIDTGAYASGTLTALVAYEDKTKFLSTEG
jgi:serine/threonine protein phosphatase 1